MGFHWGDFTPTYRSYKSITPFYTLRKTNIAIENPPFWWYLQGNMKIFMGELLVSGRVTAFPGAHRFINTLLVSKTRVGLQTETMKAEVESGASRES